MRGAVASRGGDDGEAFAGGLLGELGRVTGMLRGAELGVSAPTIYSALGALEDLGVVEEITGRRRNRVWVYADYVAILNAGTDTPPG